MLKSERFRTTVRDPPFAYDCVQDKFATNMSRHQLETEQIKEEIKKREKQSKSMHATQSLLLRAQ